MPINLTPEEGAALLRRAASEAEAKARQIVFEGASELQRLTMANSSGRPGPIERSGDFRRSWTLSMLLGGQGKVGAVVGNNSPQAMRLEFGFVGTDRAGRVYRTAYPYPSIGPAAQVVGPKLRKMLVEGMGKQAQFLKGGI